MDNSKIITTEQFIKRAGDLCLKSGMSGLPKDETDQHILLKSTMLAFDVQQEYSEQEVNEKLAYWCSRISQIKDLDHVTLRRRLVDTGYLIRSSDGSSYQAALSGPYQPVFEEGILRVNLEEILQAKKEEIERRKQEFMARNK